MDVHVMGAGASYHAGYPLAAQLWNRLKSWSVEHTTRREYYAPLFALLDTWAGDFDTAQFENLITSFENDPLKDWLWINGGRTRLQSVICDLFAAIREESSANGYAAFARNRVNCGDVIITFNYDLALERELRLAGKWKIDNGYGFRFAGRSERSPVTVFKLHGSTNWLGLSLGGAAEMGPSAVPLSAVIQGNELLDDRPFIPARELEFLGYQNLTDPLVAGLGGNVLAVPPVILPSYNKARYFGEWPAFWEPLWQRAKQYVDRADRIFVHGYQMPEADENAAELILGSQNKKASVTICCYDKRVNSNLKKRFEDRGFKWVEQMDGLKFEDWALNSCDR